ncbi:MAG: PKD domain-containing protein [Aureispira sp.]
MRKIICISIVLITLSCLRLTAQGRKRVFFIGNSYTYANNLPQVLSNIATSFGDTVIHASSTPGGAQLVQHVTNTNTLNGIRQGNWDVVVIQEQSQKPSFGDAQVATDVYPYAAQLNDSIAYYNPCAETAFYMTWGRQNGDAQNCPFLPALCTFEGMNARLRRAYLRMALDNQAIAAPVGAVWKMVRDSLPSINLYTADGSHPSRAGTYLAACTFYATIFRRGVTGSSYYGNVPMADAQQIQQLVDHVVLDSLSNWYIDAYDVQADFATTINGNTLSLTNNSQQATNYQWDFGDASPIDNTANPSHTYTTTGTYIVRLVASNTCGKIDTSTQTITIATILNTPTLPSSKPHVEIYPNPSNGIFSVQCPTGIQELRIISLLGQELLHMKNLEHPKQEIKLDGAEFEGIHYLYIKDEQGRESMEQLSVY